MQKTLFSRVYRIRKIKIFICVSWSMIADKKCQSGKLKLYKTLMFLPLHFIFRSLHFLFFCFSLFIFSSIGNLWSLPGCKYAEFILIFGFLNIVIIVDKERE